MVQLRSCNRRWRIRNPMCRGGISQPTRILCAALLLLSCFRSFSGSQQALKARPTCRLPYKSTAPQVNSAWTSISVPPALGAPPVLPERQRSAEITTRLRSLLMVSLHSHYSRGSLARLVRKGRQDRQEQRGRWGLPDQRDQPDLRGQLVPPAVLDPLAPRDQLVPPAVLDPLGLQDRLGRKAKSATLDQRDRPGPPDRRACLDRRGLPGQPARSFPWTTPWWCIRR